MRENIYGPENRIVSAQMGVGYSLPVWLPPEARPRTAVPYHFDLPPPRVAQTAQWYVSGPVVDGYPTWTQYVQWASYNAKGEVVGTYEGSQYRKVVSVGGWGDSFEFVLSNWPSNGSASWIVHNGSGIGSTSGYGSMSETPSSLISPTYAEILAQDKANGTGGSFLGLYASDGELLGDKVYEERWSNGSLSRYYSRNIYMSPAGLYGGYTGAFSYTTEVNTPDTEERWQNTHNLASTLPEDIVPPAASFDTVAETYNYYIEGPYLSKTDVSTGLLDRGDGVIASHLTHNSYAVVAGVNMEGLETHPDAVIEDEQVVGLRVAGTCSIEATEYPSLLVNGAKLARLRFTNFCVGGYSDKYRGDGVLWVISGTYVAGIENTLAFVPLEQHPHSRRVTFEKDYSSIDAMYAFYRADVAKANAHLRRWAKTYFKKCMREWSQGKGTVPRLFLRKIARAAKSSKGVKRKVPLTVSTSYRLLSDTANADFPSYRDIVYEYTFTFSYTVTKTNEEGVVEEVTKTGSVVGTRGSYYDKSPTGRAIQHTVLHDYYYAAGLALNDALLDIPGTRFPDKSIGTERSSETVAAGYYVFSGEYTSLSYVEARRGAEYLYFAQVQTLHADYSTKLTYGDLPTTFPLSARIPDIVKQYMEEVPLVYAAGEGEPTWVETYLYDGQQVALTWFGPEGGGPFSPWQDTDEYAEVYGQLVCKYVAAEAALQVLRWIPVHTANKTFLIEDVPVTHQTEDGPVVVHEDVALPTARIPRPLSIPKDRIFRALGGDVRTPNCIVTFGSVKWPDITEYAKQRNRDSVGVEPLHTHILSVFRGL